MSADHNTFLRYAVFERALRKVQQMLPCWLASSTHQCSPVSGKDCVCALRFTLPKTETVEILICLLLHVWKAMEKQFDERL